MPPAARYGRNGLGRESRPRSESSPPVMSPPVEPFGKAGFERAVLSQLGAGPSPLPIDVQHRLESDHRCVDIHEDDLCVGLVQDLPFVGLRPEGTLLTAEQPPDP